jgi:hypothetical protein
MCSVLYAIGSYLTAYIPSPWGVGQFRPAVVIPAFFAVIFGPIPAGIGAALGTLIADSVKHGYLYPGSYLAAVPGNFLGFYLFGVITKKFNWRRFIMASHVTLTIANAVVAVLYIIVFKILYLGDPKYIAFSPQALTTIILGLTIWWFVTMLPFVLLVTPALISVVATTFPSLVSEDVHQHGILNELPDKAFILALLIPGIVMLLTGIAITFTPLGEAMTTFFGSVTVSLIELMFYLSGIILVLLGLVFRTTRKQIVF